MTVNVVWLCWFLAIVLMLASARWPMVGRVSLFNLAWAFALLAVAWPVLR